MIERNLAAQGTGVESLTPDNIRRAGSCYQKLQNLEKDYRRKNATVRDCKSKAVSILIGVLMGITVLSIPVKLGIQFRIPLLPVMFISISLSVIVREIMYRSAKSRLERLKLSITEIAAKNQEYIHIVPVNYRYPLACNFMAEVLECGRADNLKEALNLFEEQIHRWKMEQGMSRMLENQQRSNRALWTLIGTNVFFR